MLKLNRQTVFFGEFKYRRRLSDVYVEEATALEPLSATKEGTINLLENELVDFNNQFYNIFKKTILPNHKDDRTMFGIK